MAPDPCVAMSRVVAHGAPMTCREFYRRETAAQKHHRSRDRFGNASATPWLRRDSMLKLSYAFIGGGRRSRQMNNGIT
jgi:hypothetical protein